MGDGPGRPISEEELEEALEYLAEQGELDYLVDPTGDPVEDGEEEEEEESAVTVAEYFERSGDCLGDRRVAHAALRAVHLVSVMVGSLSHRGLQQSALVEAATHSIESDIKTTFLQLNGVQVG